MKNSLKLILVFLLVIFSHAAAQKKDDRAKKKYNYILTTTDTKEIEKFLATTNPEDPRFPISKRRLVQLKNTQWMKNGPVIFMASRPITKEVDDDARILRIKNSIDEKEFIALIDLKHKNHTAKTVTLLNAMFNPDLKSDEKIVLVRNRSSCNIILSMNGLNALKLAVPAKGEDFAVVKKGDYNLEANVCGVSYKSAKNFQENQILTLDAPVMIGLK